MILAECELLSLHPLSVSYISLETLHFLSLECKLALGVSALALTLNDSPLLREMLPIHNNISNATNDGSGLSSFINIGKKRWYVFENVFFEMLELILEVFGNSADTALARKNFRRRYFSKLRSWPGTKLSLLILFKHPQVNESWQLTEFNRHDRPK